MRLRRRPRAYDLPPVHLFRDDLDQAVEIIQKAMGGVLIVCEDYDYESLDELAKAKGAHPTEIAVSDPELGVELAFTRKPPASALRCGPTDASEACFHRIKAIVDMRRRWMALPAVMAWLPPVALLSVRLGIFKESLDAAFPSWTQRAGIMLLAVFFPTVYLLGRFGFLWRVDLRRRHETSSFLQRKGDELLLVVIGALLGILVAWLAK